MTSLFLAALAATQAAPATAPAPAAPPVATGRSLRDLPGLTLTYHDLSEKDVKAISKALKTNKPLTPQQQQLLSASTNWNVAPTFTKRTTNGANCTITKVNVAFTAKADLPRFNTAWIKPADLPSWQTFMSNIETQAAAKLWLPYDRMANFDKAMVGKPCDEAIRDGGAMLDKIKAEAAAFQPQAPVAAAPPAAPAQ